MTTGLGQRRATLGFLQLAPTEPELRLLHRAFDSWSGLGLIAVGMACQGFRLSLSHIADGEWRAAYMGDNTLLAPDGYGVAATPWAAVRAAWAALR